MTYLHSTYHRFDKIGYIVGTDDLDNSTANAVPPHLKQPGNRFFVAYLQNQPIAWVVIDQNRNILSGTFPCDLKPIPNPKSKSKVENFLRSFAKDRMPVVGAGEINCLPKSAVVV